MFSEIFHQQDTKCLSAFVKQLIFLPLVSHVREPKDKSCLAFRFTMQLFINESCILLGFQ
jgi:hypothetical protein